MLTFGRLHPDGIQSLRGGVCEKPSPSLTMYKTWTNATLTIIKHGAPLIDLGSRWRGLLNRFPPTTTIDVHRWEPHNSFVASWERCSFIHVLVTIFTIKLVTNTSLTGMIYCRRRTQDLVIDCSLFRRCRLASWCFMVVHLCFRTRVLTRDIAVRYGERCILFDNNGAGQAICW